MSPTATDLLDFDSDSLYFERPLQPETERLLMDASHHYGEPEAETALMRAYFLEPGHLSVLVALYRFFFYQHRYVETLLVAERALDESARLLGLCVPWQKLGMADLTQATQVSMASTRFYLMTLKGAGYLKLRLGEPTEALKRFTKVAELDVADRLNMGSLIELAQETVTVLRR